MARWLPTFNVLKISTLFVNAPTKKRCCYEVSKDMKLPHTTAFEALRTMEKAGWLASENEKINRSLTHRPRHRVLYRITGEGMRAAVSALTALQIHRTILLSS